MKFIVAAILDENSDNLQCQFISMDFQINGIETKVVDVFEMQKI